MNRFEPPLKRNIDSSKRMTLFGAAVGAIAAGAYLGYWTWVRPHSGDATTQAWWALHYYDLQGREWPTQQLKGRPLLVNFWATWCPPCVEELPLIDKFYQENTANGWQVLAIAIDKPLSVEAFVTRLSLKMPVAVAGFEGLTMAQNLGNPNKSLPFSAVFGSDGSLAGTHLGALSAQKLQSWKQQVR